MNYLSVLDVTPEGWVYRKGHIGSKIAAFVSTDHLKYDDMHIHNGEKIYGNMSSESEANARLIASAPEMLNGLMEFCMRVEEGSIRSRKTFSSYKSIIEKATGERWEYLSRKIKEKK